MILNSLRVDILFVPILQVFAKKGKIIVQPENISHDLHSSIPLERQCQP